MMESESSSQATPSNIEAAVPASSEPPAWRRFAALAGCVILGAVLLVAGWAKSLDPSSFADLVHSEGLDFLLPAMAVAMIALFLEWFLGFALIMGVRHRWIFWPTAALVVFFVFLTGRKYLAHLQGVAPADDGSCGCFGNLVERTPAEAFWQDFLLMVPALLLMALAISTSRRLPWKRLVIAAVLGLGFTIFAWNAPSLPLDNLATRLKPGIAPFSLCAGSAEDGSRVCLDAILPELATGEHLVVLADVKAEVFTEAIPELNTFAWEDGVPALWVLSSATEEELFELRFGHGPTFEIRETPSALMAPLYRTLPRSFWVKDGTVVETFAGLPPWNDFRDPQN